MRRKSLSKEYDSGNELVSQNLSALTVSEFPVAVIISGHPGTRESVRC